MIFINPLYVLSNVIFINTDTEYVLIEKKCWNTMVNQIFKRRQRSAQDLKKLKSLIYLTYVAYCNNQIIDYAHFNSIIGELQMVNPEILNKVKTTLPVPMNISTVDVKVEEDSFFFDDEFIEPMSEDQVKKSEELSLIVSKAKSLENKFDELLNLSLSKNKYFSQIVELAGFSRLRNLMKQLAVSGDLKLNGKFEKIYFKENMEFIAKMLISNSKDIPGSRKIITFCEQCNSINSHTDRLLNPRNIDHELEKCDGSISYFDFSGRIESFVNESEFMYFGAKYPYKLELKFLKHSFHVTFQSKMLVSNPNYRPQIDRKMYLERDGPYQFYHEFSFKDDIHIANLLEFIELEFQNHVVFPSETARKRTLDLENGIAFWDDITQDPGNSKYYEFYCSKLLVDNGRHKFKTSKYFETEPFVSRLYLDSYVESNFHESKWNGIHILNPNQISLVKSEPTGMFNFGGN